MKAPDKIYLHGYPDKPFLCQDWDVAPTMRVVRGQQAENIAYIRADLAEPTWEDIKSICRLKEDVELDVENGFVQVPEEIQFKEVLRRFLESKKEG